MEEIWKDIEGYESLYQISNKGNIRSFKNKKIKTLNPSIMKCGYFRIALSDDRKKFLVHRLVAIAFIPNLENKPCVNHIDGDKTNNNDWNLEWNTHSENTQHAYDINLMFDKKGSNHPLSKLNEKQVLEIRNSVLTYYKLGEIYGVSFSTIGNIKNRATWKHI